MLSLSLTHNHAEKEQYLFPLISRKSATNRNRIRNCFRRVSILQDLSVSMSTQGAFLFNKRKGEDSPPLPSSSSSSSKSRWKYEVFLSFRGKDTRKSFTDHLFHALKEKGIFTFRDDERLERGTTISEELLKAIEESRFAIVIFSENYASSGWCLDELVHIVRCKKEVGLKVVPIFYHVIPSNVRHQEGTFAQAFVKHKELGEKVETWRAALREVADLSGWDLQDRHEAEVIRQIVEDIRKELRKWSLEFLSFTKNLVGIDSHMEKLIPSYLGTGNRVYMSGICGMGGLGKTTLARAIYCRYSKFFEGSSFIQSVRERSKSSLLEMQQQLLEQILGRQEKIWDVDEGVEIIKKRLRHKKVLLVLDDVDHVDQLEKLAGEYVLDDVDHVDQLEKLAGEHDWFGLGSWIIITTRDEHVLLHHGELKIYKPNGLEYVDALKLFCLKAFKKEQPKEGYMQLSQKVVKYASGLPLALVTLGSFLVRRTVEEWQSALDSFKDIKGDIHDILKISYDGLEDTWKNIFLDIACFFRGWGKDQVIEILKNCDFKAEIGISVLVEKSLLTIDHNNYLGMHDLLVEMGQKIICFESGGKLGKQSRLWLVENLLHVLEKDMATDAIQAIVVEGWKEDFNLEEISEGFSKMSNLRLLIIHSMSSLNGQRHLALPNNLRYLGWKNCPFKCLAFSHKQRMAFVHLDLQYGQFEYLWEGVMRSANLKYMDLSCSKNLNRTPDFSGVPNLEELRLSRCGQLVEIHPSIGQLSRLRYLDLRDCESLTNLPSMSAEMMQSLMVLDLYRCSKISLFPEFSGIMKSLSTLNLAWTGIKKVEPSSIECLPALTFLDLSHCTILECLPSNMDNLKYLKYIDLSSSQNLIKTPDFSGVPILEELRLSNCGRLVEIHPSIGQLSRLGYLDLYGCNNLTDLPCMSAVMQSLTVLDLSRCCKISLFPKFTGIMKSLSELNLSWTAIEKVEPSSIECLTALAFLDLTHCSRLECLPSNMDNLKSLKTLDLSQCSKLKSLPRLPSNVSCIEPEGFSFLNWSPEGVKLCIWSQPLSQWLPFDESGSLVGFTKLFHFLRGLFFHKAVLGGYIIRSWSAVKEGFSINIKLPSNWYNCKWIGFALWASLPRVVEVKDVIRARVIAPGGILWNDGVSEHSTTYINGICLLYLSREVWFRTVGNDECSQITVIFENNNSPLHGVSYSTEHLWGECGVSFIYKQGVVRVDELNETNAPCFIESFGEVSIYKLTGGDDDVHIVDDDGVHKFRDDVHKFGDDDFDDDDI